MHLRLMAQDKAAFRSTREGLKLGMWSSVCSLGNCFGYIIHVACALVSNWHKPFTVQREEN